MLADVLRVTTLMALIALCAGAALHVLFRGGDAEVDCLRAWHDRRWVPIAMDLFESSYVGASDDIFTVR